VSSSQTPDQGAHSEFAQRNGGSLMRTAVRLEFSIPDQSDRIAISCDAGVSATLAERAARAAYAERPEWRAHVLSQRATRITDRCEPEVHHDDPRRRVLGAIAR